MRQILVSEKEERLNVVVFATGENILGPVELLGEDESHQLMRKDQLRQGPLKVRALMNRGVYAVSPANDDDDVA